MDDKKLFFFYTHSHLARVSKSRHHKRKAGRFTQFLWYMPHTFHILANFSHQFFPPKARFTVKTKSSMKGMTTGWRGRLKVVAFDRSPFKLFTLRFSDKSVPAPSCERPKIRSEPCCLLFEINNCLAATHFSHHPLNWNNGIVHPPR